ncbi:MAG: DUF2497 domain-containing protein [Alphaproteobacteria bacterium]|jgi:cell pole-organizing protein PopZ
MTDQNEPSMEDILASIRNILADGEGTAPAPEAKKDAPAVNENVPAAPVPSEEAPAEDVMELTSEMIVHDAPEEEDDFKPEPVVKPEEIETIALEEELPDLPAESGEDAFSERATVAPVSADDGEALLSAPAVEAAAASLSHLTKMFSSDRQASVGNGALTLEAMVRALLRPLLKEWLDRNLPDVVERVVKKEVARVMDRLEK